MDNGFEMSEIDVLLGKSQTVMDSGFNPDYRDPLLSQLTEQELYGSGTLSDSGLNPLHSACSQCPLAMWFLRNLRQGPPQLTAYCGVMHLMTYGGDGRNEIGCVSRCGKQIQALAAWRGGE